MNLNIFQIGVSDDKKTKENDVYKNDDLEVYPGHARDVTSEVTFFNELLTFS